MVNNKFRYERNNYFHFIKSRAIKKKKQTYKTDNPALKVEKQSGRLGEANKPGKGWEALKAESSWRMFKIMSEFVDGFERMETFGPCISIFGSARTEQHNKYFKLAETIAEKLVKEGYGIITGGGPGIMEAGNMGAKKAGGKSVGLHIELKHEQDWNHYIDTDKLLIFKYFFARKVMFVRYAQAFIYLPGGFGTMDEMFEVITLIQTAKIDRIPVILLGTEYWSGLFEWIRKTVLAEKNISPEDLDLFQLTDDPDKVIKIIRKHYKRQSLSPNLKL